MNKIIEALYDRSDAEKWAHPELVGLYDFLAGPSSTAVEAVNTYYNFNIPAEERREITRNVAKGIIDAAFDIPDNPSVTRREIYKVPGCPEEPDTEAEVIIYRPLKATKKKLPVVFVAPGGGMYVCMVENDTHWTWADKFNCVVAVVRYRTAPEAKYPAALNDLHAGYKWVVDNAAELGINSDKIVLTGSSSGSNLIMSLAHRLKRYGYRPRGCVAICCFADNRPKFNTSTIMNNDWDGRSQWLSSLEYLGMNNVYAFNNPEMYPNYATVEDCIGLCPTFMHPDSEDAGVDSCREYASKLSKAGVYNELHCWGGSCHASAKGVADNDPTSDYGKRYQAVLEGNFMDCIKYDLRRQWIVDELVPSLKE